MGTSYAANVGPQFNSLARATSSSGVGVGLWASRVSYSIRDCTDGTSNTVAFGEALIGDNTAATPGGAEFYNCVAWPGSANGSGAGMVPPNPAAITNLRTYVQNCISAQNSGAGQQNSRGQYWAAHRMGIGPIASALQTPNSKNPDCQNTHENGTMTMRSKHSGGVNALLADGSVRFIKDSVSETTWWALGTKAGNEVVSSDSF